jgi:ferredoxin
MSKIWPVISSRKEPMPDADSNNGRKGKRAEIEK